MYATIMMFIITHRMRALQCRCARLGCSDVIELAFLYESGESSGRLFNRYIPIDSSTFEEVQLLFSAELFEDNVDAALEVFRPGNS